MSCASKTLIFLSPRIRDRLANQAPEPKKKRLALAVVCIVALTFLVYWVNWVYLPSIPCGGGCLKPLAGELSVQDVDCSLATGVCSFAIANNSTAPLELERCSLTVSVGPGETSGVSGTVGGSATAWIPAHSSAPATCTIPTTQLAHQDSGSSGGGFYVLRFAESGGGYPAGTETSDNFYFTWSP